MQNKKLADKSVRKVSWLKGRLQSRERCARQQSLSFLHPMLLAAMFWKCCVIAIGVLCLLAQGVRAEDLELNLSNNAAVDPINWDSVKTALGGRPATDYDVIIIHNRPLPTIPSWIFSKMSHIKKLELTGNQIREIPSEIGQLTQLTLLNLAGNKITKLPQSIGNLVNLEVLGMTRNALKDIGGIEKCVRLKDLYLNDNHLEDLPDDIGNLASLQKLYLRGSSLRLLPRSIKECNDLTVLDLTQNSSFLDKSEGAYLGKNDLKAFFGERVRF
ncbi:MAG: leucine-rich repeat domain-containing protein [Holosporaceae bacterium]